MTEKIIEEFSKTAQYFIMEEFPKFLINKNFDNKEDYIDLLSEIYYNGLNFKKFDIPLLFIIIEKKIFQKI